MRKRREVEDLRERERREREEMEERRLRKLKEEEEEEVGEDGMDSDEAEGGGMAGKRKREHVVDGSSKDEGDIDPKKRELLERQKRQMAQMAANGQRAGNTAAARQTAEEVRAKKEMANMNLSDSSSSEEEDSSEEE